MKSERMIGTFLAATALLGWAAWLEGGGRVALAPLGNGSVLSVADCVSSGASTTAGGDILNVGQTLIGDSSGTGVNLHAGAIAVLALYVPEPDPPINLTATPTSGLAIDLEWTDQSDDEDGFIIERKVEDGSFVYLDTVGPNITTYTDDTCDCLTTYTYRVRAYRDAAYSDWSNEASATTWCAGDTDGDGDVDAVDLAALGLNWAPDATDKTWGQGDFDGDGDVDAVDLAALGLNWAPEGYGGAEPDQGAVGVPSGEAPHLVATEPALGAATAGLKRIALVFDRKMLVGGGAVEVHGLATGPKTGASVTCDADGRTVLVTWPEPLAPDVYEVRLVADALVGAVDEVPLDGEVADPVDPASLPSGDGEAGGDARIELEAR